MLTLFSGRGQRDCAGLSRRDFLQAGLLGLGGLTLPWLLRTRAQAADDLPYVRDKAVVLIFLGFTAGAFSQTAGIFSLAHNQRSCGSGT